MITLPSSSLDIFHSPSPTPNHQAHPVTRRCQWASSATTGCVLPGGLPYPVFSAWHAGHHFMNFWIIYSELPTTVISFP